MIKKLTQEEMENTLNINIKKEISLLLSKVNLYLLVDTYIKYFLITGIILLVSQKNILLSMLFVILKFISSKLLFIDKQPIVRKIDIVVYIIATVIGMWAMYTINTNIILKL